MLVWKPTNGGFLPKTDVHKPEMPLDINGNWITSSFCCSDDCQPSHTPNLQSTRYQDRHKLKSEVHKWRVVLINISKSQFITSCRDGLRNYRKHPNRQSSISEMVFLMHRIVNNSSLILKDLRVFPTGEESPGNRTVTSEESTEYWLATLQTTLGPLLSKWTNEPKAL